MAEDLDVMNLGKGVLDKIILEMIDWKKYRPACISVEAITYEMQQE